MNNRTLVSELATTFLKQNNPTGWFEELYSQAEGDADLIPWANLTVNTHLADWLTRNQLEDEEKKALVVGCGLGDDAEALSNMGYRVTGFDISPSAIAWSQKRFPNTSIKYVVSNALQTETAWENKFDLLLEAYTLQALRQSVRQQIMSNLVNYLTPGGILLIICRGRDLKPDAGESPPWALTREELSYFSQLGLKEVSFEDYLDREHPPVRRFRITYTNSSN